MNKIETHDNLKKYVKKLEGMVMTEKSENENLRKRFHKELETTRKFVLIKFVKHFTEQIENLFRALDNIDILSCRNNPELRVLFEGVNITKKNILKVFSNFKIDRIYPLNCIFDYKFHEAVSQISNDHVSDNTVISVIQAGYIMQTTLIKPAIVIVSKKN